MGNSDDDSDFAEYGTALEPIEEDDVARKKPITVAEQIAVDEKGRRRFHGAFTGGFSAGYFNTVGSKEGWAPSTFKSTRGERGSFKSQNVLDFMDEEDKGAFGIAPQILRPTDDFADKNENRTKKRPLAQQSQSDGPIPGVPVLEQIIQPVKETVGIRILIRMGWRPGKGVGPKVQRKAKKPRLEHPPEIIQQEDVDMEGDDDDGDGGGGNQRKIYGCSIPSELLKRGGGAQSDSEDSEDLPEEAEQLLAPDDVSSLLCNPKENSFGLGYKGLDRNALSSTSSHVDLFGGTKLKFRVENKHMSISGEAFGVGAFEDNDDDIYSREDMTQYDFALETPEEKRRKRAKEELDKRKSKNKENCIEGFKLSSTATKLIRKSYPPPPLPRNFQPYHEVKRSRFETKAPTADSEEKRETAAKGLSRHSLTISERQVLIEDDVNKIRREESSSKKGDEMEQSSSSSSAVEPKPNETEKNSDAPPAPDKPTAAQMDADIQHRIERLKKFTQVLQAYSSNKPDETQKASFKPFMKNPEKQERYEKYLTLRDAGFSESLRDLQPPDMAEWEREREKMEFERASKLYKPMNSILSSRFTSAKSHDISHLDPEKEAVKEKDPKDDPKVAAKMKLFGKLTHKIVEWHPDKLVSKRFNVPHPFPDSKFVGVKGDASFKTSSNPASAANIEPAAVALQPAPKKSLFENLDFSKPPPGLLLPPGAVFQPSSTGSPMESSDDPGDGTQPSMLAFQKELSAKSKEDDDDEVPAQPERPPLDLFKEIFADSSEDSEDDEEPATPLTRPEKKNEQSQHSPSKSQHMPAAKNLPSHYPRNSLPEIDRANQKTSPPPPPPTASSYQRRVFDKIDLDKMQTSSIPARQISDSDTIPRKSNKNNGNEEENEDEEDMYGPLPPKPATTSSASNNNAPSTRQDPLKPKFIPRSSSKLTTPVSSSSSLMNYGNHQVQSKSHKDDVSKTKDGDKEEVVWIEKSALTDKSSSSGKSHGKSKKRTSSAKKSKKKSSKKEKEKHKSHKSSKDKDKRHKHKKKGSRSSSSKHKSSKKGKHNSSSSESSSGDEDDSGGTSSDSSVTINDSLDNRALLAKLKRDYKI